MVFSLFLWCVVLASYWSKLQYSTRLPREVCLWPSCQLIACINPHKDLLTFEVSGNESDTICWISHLHSMKTSGSSLILSLSKAETSLGMWVRAEACEDHHEGEQQALSLTWLSILNVVFHCRKTVRKWLHHKVFHSNVTQLDWVGIHLPLTEAGDVLLL